MLEGSFPAESKPIFCKSMLILQAIYKISTRFLQHSTHIVCRYLDIYKIYAHICTAVTICDIASYDWRSGEIYRILPSPVSIRLASQLLGFNQNCTNLKQNKTRCFAEVGKFKKILGTSRSKSPSTKRFSTLKPELLRHLWGPVLPSPNHSKQRKRHAVRQGIQKLAPFSRLEHCRSQIRVNICSQPK